MSWYNGYSPKERNDKGKARPEAIRNGSLVPYTGPCMLCADPSVPVEPHSEDYSMEYRWTPPAVYWLCGNCHKDKLHKRFADKDRWNAFKDHVRRGGYARDLKDPVIARELKEYWANKASGAKLRELRPRQLAAKEWWEELSTNPASLTDPKSRPRP